jgi:hypothetical protein
VNISKRKRRILLGFCFLGLILLYGCNPETWSPNEIFNQNGDGTNVSTPFQTDGGGGSVPSNPDSSGIHPSKGVEGGPPPEDPLPAK